MKKRINFILLALLLVVALGGCIIILDDTTVEDYRELEAVFRDPGDASFTGEFFIDILNGEDPAIRYHTSGSHIIATEAYQATFDFREANGTPLFEVSVISANGKTYFSADYFIDLVLEESGLFDDPDFMDGIDLSPEALLGEYRYIDLTLDEPEEWDEDQVCICYIFSDEVLERYLSRGENSFIIAIEGESVRRVVEHHIDAFLLEFALGGVWYVEDMFPDIAAFLNNASAHPSRIVRGADLSDAHIVVERSQTGDVLYQMLNLYIPDRVHITATVAYDAGHVPPISPPERYLTIDELYERIFDAMMGGFEAPDLDTVYDLVGLTLFDHDLSDSSFLESYALRSPSGERQEVTVISGGDLHLMEPGSIFWDAWAIELYYTLVPDSDAISVITEFSAFALLGDQLHVGPLRVSADHQAAALGVISDTFGFPVGILYLAEAIPGTEYTLLLQLLLFSELLDDTDFDILDELSTHMGIDLAESLAALFDESF
ncbi:MAG: hypothetical protein FWD99_07080 [Oscillospiraceae bacterium]|nr:hypothetical protein [Oscillospiraceae bacterium]